MKPTSWRSLLDGRMCQYGEGWGLNWWLTCWTMMRGEEEWVFLEGHLLLRKSVFNMPAGSSLIFHIALSMPVLMGDWCSWLSCNGSRCELSRHLHIASTIRLRSYSAFVIPCLSLLPIWLARKIWVEILLWQWSAKRLIKIGTLHAVLLWLIFVSYDIYDARINRILNACLV